MEKFHPANGNRNNTSPKENLLDGGFESCPISILPRK
jgi:hypothetical protein